MIAGNDTGFLRETPWFRELEDGILQDLLGATTPRSLAAGEILFTEGQEFQGVVYILEQGDIEVSRSKRRKERVMPGYVLGLSSYLADAPYPATATAITNSEVRVLDGRALWALEHKHPPLFDALNRLIAQKLRERSVSHSPVSGVLMQPVMAVMGTPLTTCPAEASLKQAFQMMRERGVGSIPIVNGKRELLGLVTYPSLAQVLIEGGADPDGEVVRNACRPAHTVRSTSPLWKAEEILEAERVKHLVVTEDSQPVGMLSQTDILHALMSRLGSLRASVAAAASMSELNKLYRQMGDIAAETLERNRRARTSVMLISELHLAIQRRCIELTIQHMESEGWGPPPVAYAFIIMGSGGRKEMMLNPDQDNGIILADERTRTKRVQPWFETFCRRTNENLDRVGYILCKGNIMAMNPAYHKSLQEWKAQIDHMVESPNEKAARFSNIVFDFRTLYGEESLTRELRDHVHTALAGNPRLLQYMVQDDAEGRPPLNLFNQLITQGEKGEYGKVDVKRNGLRIIADAARILALSAGIGNCNTHDRIRALVRQGVISSDFAATVSSAYDELLDITLTHQIEQYRAGIEPDKLVVTRNLTSATRESLRVAMRGVKRFQDLLHDKIGAVSLPF